MSYDIPSVSELEAVQLLNKHYAEVITSKKDGIASGSDITQTKNPITGVTRRTLYKILDDVQAEHDNQMQSFENDFDSRLAGMAFTRVGSFTTGATLTDMRQVVVWEVSQGGDGHEYGWTGTFPKVVAAGATPATSGGIGAGAWVDRTDVTFRSDINVVVKRFASVADMVADTSLQLGQVVETLGYYGDWVATVAKPKGGNQYEVVASGTGTPDGGAFINLSNGLQLKGLFIDGEISAEQFGAKGDGVVDDWRSIQNAIDCILGNRTSSKTRTVKIGAGHFRISNTIFLGYGIHYDTICFIGDGGAQYGVVDNFNGTYILPDFTDRPAINTQGLRNSKIADITIVAKYFDEWTRLNWPPHVAASYDIRCTEANYINPNFSASAYSSTAPYAGICIDGYTKKTAGLPDNYYPAIPFPSFVPLASQKHYGLNASSVVKIDHVNIIGFAVGLVTQPASQGALNEQGVNGDFVSLTKSVIDKCKYGMSTSHTDARLLSAIDSCIFGCWTALTNTTHGGKVGKFDGAFINTCFDGCRYIMTLDGGRTGKLQLQSCYGEQVVSMGSFANSYSSSADSLVIESCNFRSIDDDTNGNPGPYLRARECKMVRLSNSSFNNRSVVLLDIGNPTIDMCTFGDEYTSSIPTLHARAKFNCGNLALFSQNFLAKANGYNRYATSGLDGAWGRIERNLGRSRTLSIYADCAASNSLGVVRYVHPTLNTYQGQTNQIFNIVGVNQYTVTVNSQTIALFTLGDMVLLYDYATGHDSTVVAFYVTAIDTVNNKLSLSRLSGFYYKNSVFTEIVTIADGATVKFVPTFGGGYPLQHKITGTTTAGSAVITNCLCQTALSSQISIGDVLPSSDFDRVISGWHPSVIAIDDTNRTITLSSHFNMSIPQFTIDYAVKKS